MSEESFIDTKKQPWPKKWESIKSVEIPPVAEMCGPCRIIARFTFSGSLQELDREHSEQMQTLHLIATLTESWIKEFWKETLISCGRSWLSLPQKEGSWGAVCETRSSERVLIAVYNRGALPLDRVTSIEVALRGLESCYRVPWGKKGVEKAATNSEAARETYPFDPLVTLRKYTLTLTEAGIVPAQRWEHIITQLRAIQKNEEVPVFPREQTVCSPPPLDPFSLLCELLEVLAEQEIGPDSTWSGVLTQFEAVRDGREIPRSKEKPGPQVCGLSVFRKLIGSGYDPKLTMMVMRGVQAVLTGQEIPPFVEPVVQETQFFHPDFLDSLRRWPFKLSKTQEVQWPDLHNQVRDLLSNQGIQVAGEPQGPPVNLLGWLSGLSRELDAQTILPGTTWREVYEQFIALLFGKEIPEFLDPEPDNSDLLHRMMSSGHIPASTWDGVCMQILAVMSNQEVPLFSRPVFAELVGEIELLAPTSLWMHDGKWKPRGARGSVMVRKFFTVTQAAGTYLVYLIPNPILQEGADCMGIPSPFSHFFRFRESEFWDDLVAKGKARWVTNEPSVPAE